MQEIYVVKREDEYVIGTRQEFIQEKLCFEQRRGISKAALHGRIVALSVREATHSEIEIYFMLKRKERLKMSGQTPSGKYRLVC